VIKVRYRMRETRPLSKSIVDLVMDQASFHLSLKDRSDSDWETIKNVLEYLGFEAKFVRFTLGPLLSSDSKNIIPFPAARVDDGQAKKQAANGKKPFAHDRSRVAELFPREDEPAPYRLASQKR
jgi:hypothetical protein